MSLGYTGPSEVFPGVIQACRPIQLPEGDYIGPGQFGKLPANSYWLSPYCPLDSLYIYDLSRIFSNSTHILTASTAAWKSVYINHDGYASSLPVFISIVTFALGIVVSMAAFMTIARHSRFPWQLRIAVYYACAVVITFFAQVLQFMHNRYRQGGNSVALVLTNMLRPRHQIPAYIASIMLLFSLARVSERLFERRIERRVVRFVGPAIALVSVVMAGVSMFTPVAHPVIGALRYLFELSTYLLFSICVCMRAAEVWQAAFSRELYPLTILAILASWMPCALYFADAYGWWQARIIDELCPFTTVSSVVLVWYWVQKLGDIQQSIDSERHLGRRVYGEFNKDEEVRTGQTQKLLRALDSIRA